MHDPSASAAAVNVAGQVAAISAGVRDAAIRETVRTTWRARCKARRFTPEQADRAALEYIVGVKIGLLAAQGLDGTGMHETAVDGMVSMVSELGSIGLLPSVAG